MDDPLTAEQIEVLREQKPPTLANAAAIGLRECLFIKAARITSKAWMNRADAAWEMYRLDQAIAALKLASTITYFETNGNP